MVKQTQIIAFQAKKRQAKIGGNCYPVREPETYCESRWAGKGKVMSEL